MLAKSFRTFCSMAKHPAWSIHDFHYKNVLYTAGRNPEILRQLEEEFVFYPDDILVCTYPKQGTTMVQEMIWLIKNKADVQTAKKSSLFERFPFLEFGTSAKTSDVTSGIRKAEKLSRPRLLKSHVPYDLIRRGVETPGVKVIHVMRNPKDSLVSYYHHAINQRNYNLGRDFEFFKFYEMFKDGRCGYGSYFDHTLGWWQQRHRKNILYLKYEDILENKLENIRKMAEFIEEKLSADEENIIMEHTSFQAMQENPQVNFAKGDTGIFQKDFDFIRKGEVGNWKEHFTVAQNKEFSTLIEDRLRNTDLVFRYE